MIVVLEFRAPVPTIRESIERKGIMKNKRSMYRVSFTLAVIAALFVYTIASAADEILDPNLGINGLVTTTFAGLNDASNHILLQPDGKLLVTGLYQTSTPFV